MTVTPSSCTTGASASVAGADAGLTAVSINGRYCIRKSVELCFQSEVRGPRSERLQSASEPECVGLFAKERDHVGDVLIQRQADLLGAAFQILARHGAREGLVLHPFDHRWGFEIQHALRGP